jgi:hypothetical protein
MGIMYLKLVLYIEFNQNMCAGLWDTWNSICTLIVIMFIFVAQQPLVDQGLFIVDAL